MPIEKLYTCWLCGTKFLNPEHEFTHTLHGQEMIVKIDSVFMMPDTAEEDYICMSCFRKIIIFGE